MSGVDESFKSLTLMCVLHDEEAEYVSPSGSPSRLASSASLEESQLLLEKLSSVVGTYEKVANGVIRDKSHSFGGFDVIKHVYDLIFIIPMSGLSVEIFRLIRKWMEVKKSHANRTISLELKSGTKTIRLKVEGDNAEEMYRAALDSLNKSVLALGSQSETT